MVEWGVCTVGRALAAEAVRLSAVSEQCGVAEMGGVWAFSYFDVALNSLCIPVTV